MRISSIKELCLRETTVSDNHSTRIYHTVRVKLGYLRSYAEWRKTFAQNLFDLKEFQKLSNTEYLVVMYDVRTNAYIHEYIRAENMVK